MNDFLFHFLVTVLPPCDGANVAGCSSGAVGPGRVEPFLLYDGRPVWPGEALPLDAVLDAVVVLAVIAGLLAVGAWYGVRALRTRAARRAARRELVPGLWGGGRR